MTSSRNSSVPAIIVSVLFGLASGTVAAVLVSALLPTQVLGPDASVVRALADGGEVPEAVVSATSGAARSLVVLYPRHAGKTLADRSYLPKDAVAAAVALTSDGWTVTHASALKGVKDAASLVGIVGGRAYAVSRRVDDPFTGLAFLDLDTANIPAVAFGGSDAPKAGEQVFAFDATRGTRTLTVTGIEDVPAASPADLLQSTERMQKAVRTTGDSDVLGGSMLLDRSGKLVGVLMAGGDIGMSAVPLAAFMSQVSDVFRGRGPVRPYAGIRYLDLSRLIGALSDGDQMRGALVSGSADGKSPALAPRGPAATAGIAAGDTIVAVNGEEITPRRALSDLLAEYPPGAEVTIGIRRGGNDRTVRMTLGELPSR